MKIKCKGKGVISIMSLKRKIAFYFHLACFIIPWPLYAANKQVKEPININAIGGILVEEKSMRILWERNPNTPLPMASTTKIMTCMIALEKGNLKDVVVASKRAAAAPKVKLYLQVGEKQSLEDLLYALMLQSSNDAAIAIAEHIGGSVEEFCKMMTQKAKELGAKATTFKTPNGLDSPGHQSSPYDLALITKYAYKNPTFVKIINTPARNIPSSPLEGSRPHILQNKNNFLTSYQGANGVKTGFTGLAGHCFVGGAKREDMQLFAVVLASGWGTGGRNQKYIDTIRLMEYGFENYKMFPIKKAMDQAGKIAVIKGTEDFVNLAYGESLSLPLTMEESKNISISIDMPKDIEAPIRSRIPVGQARVLVNGFLVETLPIITTSSVEKRTLWLCLQRVIDNWIDLLHE